MKQTSEGFKKQPTQEETKTKAAPQQKRVAPRK